MDPRYKGANLNNTEISDAMSVILSISDWLQIDQGLVMANLAEYRTNTGLFGLPKIMESSSHCSPDVWWKGLATNEAISPIASKLLSVPCTSAACERNWSVFGKVHTKSRNRLKIDRVEKLVAIRSNLNIVDNHRAAKKQRINEVETLLSSSDSNSSESSESENDNNDENLNYETTDLETDNITVNQLINQVIF